MKNTAYRFLLEPEIPWQFTQNSGYYDSHIERKFDIYKIILNLGKILGCEE